MCSEDERRGRDGLVSGIALGLIAAGEVSWVVAMSRKLYFLFCDGSGLSLPR